MKKPNKNEERKFTGESLAWDEGEIPICDFCGSTIDEKGLFETSKSGQVVCESKECKLQAIEEQLFQIFEETDEE